MEECGRLVVGPSCNKNEEADTRRATIEKEEEEEVGNEGGGQWACLGDILIYCCIGLVGRMVRDFRFPTHVRAQLLLDHKVFRTLEYLSLSLSKGSRTICEIYDWLVRLN